MAESATAGCDTTPIAVCGRCGQRHVTRFGSQACVAHRSAARGGGPCTNPPLRGAAVCTAHGARAPQVKAGAARRRALGEALEELDRLGREVDVDPAPAMLAMVREAAGNVAFYRSRVQELDHLLAGAQGEDVLAVLGGGGKEGREISARAPAAIYGRVDPRNWRAERHILVGLYDEERERLMRFSKMCRDCGVEEARLELEIDQARRLADVVRGTVNELLAGVLEVVAAAGVAALQEAVRAFWSEQVPVIVRRQIALVVGAEEVSA